MGNPSECIIIFIERGNHAIESRHQMSAFNQINGNEKHEDANFVQDFNDHFKSQFGIPLIQDDFKPLTLPQHEPTLTGE